MPSQSATENKFAPWHKRHRLPLIMASEISECGLACMTMVGRYHGHDIDLNGMREKYSLSHRGATIRDLVRIGNALNLSSRALRLEPKDLAKIAKPAILHWRLRHFVVLRSVSRNKVTVHDPSVGRLEYAFDEVSKYFTGIALELAPATDFTVVTAKRPMSFSSLWSDWRGIGVLIQVLGLSVALQLVTFAIPLQAQLAVDQVIMQRDTDLLTTISIAFGALVLIQAILNYLRDWTVQVLGNLAAFQLIGNVVRHMLRLPTSFFENRLAGDMISRINSTSAIQDIVTRGVIAATIDGGMALLTVAVLFIYQPVLAAVSILSVFCTTVVSLLAYPFIRRKTEQQLIYSGVERSHVMETIRNMAALKVMGREAEREAAWRNRYVKVVNATLGAGKGQLFVDTFATFANGLSLVVIIYLGARSIIVGKGLSVGMLVAFLSFRQMFSERATSLLKQISQFRLLTIHFNRLGDIVTAPAEAKFGNDEIIDTRGDIEFRGVSFRYSYNDPWIFEGFDLSIGSGEFIAISGPSGAGKTTLVKLLLGLVAPTDGKIHLDGRSATPELWRGWRNRVGVVAQGDQLLHGSIAENISFFDPELDMGRVHSAAKAAGIHQEILGMPMQYSTLVGELGGGVSGGQKQRLLLARALYREPEILVLDEGTANLDPHNEQLIADLIATLPITRIVVTHGPILLARASRRIALGRSGAGAVVVLSDETHSA